MQALQDYQEHTAIVSHHVALPQSGLPSRGMSLDVLHASAVAGCILDPAEEAEGAWTGAKQSAMHCAVQRHSGYSTLQARPGVSSSLEDIMGCLLKLQCISWLYFHPNFGLCA